MKCYQCGVSVMKEPLTRTTRKGCKEGKFKCNKCIEKNHPTIWKRISKDKITAELVSIFYSK
jgi:hypothetical protein